MFIKEIELINHVVLPATLKLDLRGKQNIVCIDGYNGSGKSFLINNIHPLANNKRFSRRYAIRKGTNGLKRILYEINKDKDVEIIHEYTSKGESHSCKSYINVYENGVKTELNPTGHTYNSDDIIKEQLNFDGTSFACSFLSPKTENLATLTSLERKKVLEATMNLTRVLGAYQLHNREVITSSKSFLKVYSKQIEDLYRKVQYNSISEFDDAITKIHLDINNCNIKKERLFRSHVEMSNKMGVLNNTNSAKELRYVTAIRDVLMAFPEFDTMTKVYRKRQVVESSLISAEYKLTEYKNKIDSLNNKMSIINNNRRIDEKVQEYTKEKEELTKSLSSKIKHVDSNTLFMIRTLCTELINLSDSIFESNLEGTLICDYSNIDKEIENYTKDLNIAREFIDKYNSTLMMNDTDDITTDFKFTDGCSGCPYYNKFVLSKKFIEDNSEKFSNAVEKFENISVTINGLTSLKHYMRTATRVMNDLEDILTPAGLDSINVKSVVKWTTACIDSTQTGLISNFKDDIITDLNRLTIIKSELESLKRRRIETDSTPYEHLNEQKISIEKLLDTCVTGIETNTKFMDKYNKFEDIPRGDLDSSKMESINKKFDELRNFSINKNRLKKTMNDLDKDMRNNDATISSLKHKLVTLTTNKESLVDTSTYISDLKTKLERHNILKTILEKTIPLQLLSENVKFIETMVNSIMEDNNIALSLEIKCDETDIRIPVFTKIREVDDIALVSTGEMCLLGIALNAVVMHVIGYSIISFDELDANLDIVYREKFTSLLTTIMDKLDIDQIFCISHNVSWDMPASHIVLQDYDISQIQGDIIEY